MAAVIDAGLVFGSMWLLSKLLFAIELVYPSTLLLNFVVGSVPILYKLATEGTLSTTLGKWLLGLTILQQQNGKAITVAQVLKRNVLFFLIHVWLILLAARHFPFLYRTIGSFNLFVALEHYTVLAAQISLPLNAFVILFTAQAQTLTDKWAKTICIRSDFLS
jgi:uncharacterized RDD family membrane protein YckC